MLKIYFKIYLLLLLLFKIATNEENVSYSGFISNEKSDEYPSSRSIDESRRCNLDAKLPSSVIGGTVAFGAIQRTLLIKRVGKMLHDIYVYMYIHWKCTRAQTHIYIYIHSLQVIFPKASSCWSHPPFQHFGVLTSKPFKFSVSRSNGRVYFWI